MLMLPSDNSAVHGVCRSPLSPLSPHSPRKTSLRRHPRCASVVYRLLPFAVSALPAAASLLRVGRSRFGLGRHGVASSAAAFAPFRPPPRKARVGYAGSLPAPRCPAALRLLSRSALHASSAPAREPPVVEDSRYDLTNAAAGLGGTSYDPTSFESDVYSWWEAAGCFRPDAKQSAAASASAGREPYVLPMPPPNVTGRLHMGHAIFVALQDVLARFHRMRGRPVLWTPGTDHAGIATQLQVEKVLAGEGRRRGTDEEMAAAVGDAAALAEMVGREEFLERAWRYKEEQGGAITQQLRALGASADWTRERFTLDPALSEGVAEAFVRLHEKGLVYRGTYMVNWSPGLMTAVSDLEVEYSDEEGKLYYFKYLLESLEEEGVPARDDQGHMEYLAVATTRPETIFGDECVCVNPEDDRYAHLVGRRVLVPMSGPDVKDAVDGTRMANMRAIPVIADTYVDIEFGTGALKITPGHDPNDYEIGKRHELPITNVMNRDGTMNVVCGPRYEGLPRFEARDRLWGDMEAAGLTLKVEPHMQRVPRSQRGGEIIEPLVSKQWFVQTEGMSAKALEAVREGNIQVVPQRFEKEWDRWLTDTRDW